MDAETPARNPLQYATPVRPDDVDVRRHPEHFHLELGPMPASLFVATLMPHLVFPVLVITAMTVLTFPARHRTSIAEVAIGLQVLLSLRVVVRLSRHRHVARSIGATAECVYYSNAYTGGRPDALLRRDLSSIGVRRVWWQPWLFDLVAVPKSKFFSLSGGSTEPIVLLTGLDRAVLQQIAADVRQVRESSDAALSPPDTSEHAVLRHERNVTPPCPP
jgi:hypothetical protein